MYQTRKVVIEQIIAANEIKSEELLKTALELEGGVDPLVQFRIWKRVLLTRRSLKRLCLAAGIPAHEI
jgi:hypothetical protein